MAAQTINEVIEKLDAIVSESVKNNDRRGIFAYIYKRTTEQIRDEILKGAFENNNRLEAFDVHFANFYLDAYHRYNAGKSVSECWKVAFDAAQKPLTILQHALLGMNAHINFDLAVAAAEIMEGKELAGLKSDFFKVNDILAELLDEMQQKISRVSSLIFLLDWMGKRNDEKILNFSMVQARTQLWRIACELSELKDSYLEDRKMEVDRSIRNLSLFVQKPKSRILRLMLRMIASFELKQPARIIQILKN